MKLWKTKDTLEDNSIGLSRDVTARIIPELDAHLASLFTLFHQLQKHHWLVEGPQFGPLHEFLSEAYQEAHEHVDNIAERITALGGIPTCNPVAQAEIACIEHEPEGVFRARPMLSRDLEAFGVISQRLRKTITLAREHEDYGTELLLKQILLSIEDRAHHLEHFLGADSLTLGMDLESEIRRPRLAS